MLEQYTLKMPHAVYAGKGALANVKDITAQNAKKIAERFSVNTSTVYRH
jgi:DNA-binding MurR/RpiR family transcriptional regulator